MDPGPGSRIHPVGEELKTMTTHALCRYLAVLAATVLCTNLRDRAAQQGPESSKPTARATTFHDVIDPATNKVVG